MKNIDGRKLFEDDLVCRAVDMGPAPLNYIRDRRGWILFGLKDIRNSNRKYLFCLQKQPHEKLPRVLAGCRYYTLKQAWKHWHAKARKHPYKNMRNEGKQALAIISLMILQAQAYGLLSVYQTYKFDSSILKPKRRK